MYKISITIILFSLLLLPLSVQASNGIPLQKDVFLKYPIATTEDLPDQVTFNLYDSKDALSLATIVRINIGCPYYELLFKDKKTEEREIL